MDKILVKKIEGQALPVELIRKIGAIWKKEFDDAITIEKRQDFADDLFFIVFNQEDEILSVGRLRPVKIAFLNKEYKVQGIADIASVIKGKGYGKVLMLAVRRYLKTRKLTAIGFCSRKNSPFYKKCRFEITEDLTKRFFYKNPKGKLITDPDDGDDVLYLNGKSLMKQILSYPREKILTSRPLLW